MSLINGYLDDNKRYHVARGDCLWNIAEYYMGNGRRYPEIKTANGLTSNVIYVGNVFNIPGVTPGYGGAPAPAPQPTPPQSSKPNIVWFSLRADTQREMEVIWEHSSNRFRVRWQIWDLSGHLWTVSQSDVTFDNEQKAASYTYEESNDRFVCRVTIWPIDNNGNIIGDGNWQEYDFRQNPPPPPPSPEIEIDSSNNLVITFENIQENVGIEGIEVFVYQDNNSKYDSFILQVNEETRYASHTSKVDPGHYYRVKARSIRYNLPDGTKNEEGIRGTWTDYTSNEQSYPIAPEEITVLAAKKITEQGVISYGVNAEWTPVSVAKTYTIQWTTDPSYFDISPGLVESQTTEEGSGPKILLVGIDLGHEYYFRVGSNNDKGSSLDWTPIKSLRLGSRPSAPTTWSNTNSNILGEDLKLYWVHNSTDGSLETYARLHAELIKSDGTSFSFDEVIQNTRPDDDPSTVSSYTINTGDPEYALYLDGNSKIKWKVQTAGVGSEYSEWSVEREVKVYSRPTLEMDLLNRYDEPITDIYEFPFYISLIARPTTQTPISYYIEVISNNMYETIDSVGVVKTVNVGDIIYKRYVDPTINVWTIRAEMTPGVIDLQSGFEYKVRATVAMDSGLIAQVEQDFNTEFGVSNYDIYADIMIDKKTLQASIKPYAMEWIEEQGQEPYSQLAENCLLHVYRREYDGSFIEIGSEIQNGENIYLTDPHPSLDYARYRVVVKSEENGTVSYRDIESVEVHEPSIVIQWAEKWIPFDVDNNEYYEPEWAGSMLKLPYNIKTSENRNVDISLISYAGRERPVSYFGTSIDDSATWNVDIPKDDKETIYSLRRLSVYKGNVYVREPSGTGYWAVINVNFNSDYDSVIIPVTFTIKRVEGGI